MTRETKTRHYTDDSYLLELVFGGRRRDSEEVVQLRVDDVSHGAALYEVPAGRQADKESQPLLVEGALLVSCRFPVLLRGPSKCLTKIRNATEFQD